MNIKRNKGLVFKATELTFPENFYCSLVNFPKFSEQLFFRTPLDEFHLPYTCRKPTPEMVE